MFRPLILSLFLLCTVGCAQRQSGRFFSRSKFPLLTQEERARIHDISFPLEVEPRKVLFSESQMVVTYLSELSQSELSEKYHTGMEYWGWDEVGRVAAQESCLTFVKPSKVCTITLRPEGSLTRVVIFTTVKKRKGS